MNQNFSKTLGALLFHLKNHFDLIFETLSSLARHDNVYKGPDPITKEDMAKFLDSQLLGILTYFDSFLQKSSNTISDKKMVLCLSGFSMPNFILNAF